MTQPAFQTMSVEEYLRTEIDSPVRREYVNGFVYPLAQAGTTEPHDILATNFIAALHPLARRKGCRVHTSDMRVATVDRFTYYYPDVMVTCEPRDDKARIQTSPSLLVEILSKSTAHTDHFAKYHAYTSLPSLQLYLLVEQDTRLVYAYERGGGRWLKREYRESDVIPLPFLDGELSLDAIYEDVRPSL